MQYRIRPPVWHTLDKITDIYTSSPRVRLSSGLNELKLCNTERPPVWHPLDRITDIYTLSPRLRLQWIKQAEIVPVSYHRTESYHIVHI